MLTEKRISSHVRWFTISEIDRSMVREGVSQGRMQAQRRQVEPGRRTCDHHPGGAEQVGRIPAVDVVHRTCRRRASSPSPPPNIKVNHPGV